MWLVINLLKKNCATVRINLTLSYAVILYDRSVSGFKTLSRLQIFNSRERIHDQVHRHIDTMEGRVITCLISPEVSS